jgi:hypothetical protein
MTGGCSCWLLDRGITRRDGRSWDPVSGRCGRCGLPYRRVVPLPVLRLEVVMARVVTQAPGRPVTVHDLSPTEPGEVSDG